MLLPAVLALASDTVTLRELFEEADRYEGQPVTVTGEVIGDIMRDGENWWVNIKNGDFFIGIVLDETQKKSIKKTGRYGVIGDKVSVTGIYSIQCRKHLGEQDIHAETLSIIEEGSEINEPIEPVKIVLSVILAIFTIIFIYRFHRRQPRKDTGDRQS